jgi:DNA-binding beta-propeller fold protein YncE
MHPSSSDRLLLLEAKPARLLSVSLDGQDVKALVQSCGGTPDGLAIDYLHRHIFWTNMGEDWSANDGFIERIDFDGSNRTVVVPPGATFTPKQIQIDAEAGLLYWCDREGMRVMRANTDGSEITVLVETGATEEDRRDERRHCVGVAIDRPGGRIYWTQKGPPNGAQGRIFCANLEPPPGTSPTERTDVSLLFDGLPEPIDLEWDARQSFLYWTDRGDPPQGNTLNRAHIDGEKISAREILLSGLSEGIGLSLDEARGQAYVSDLGGQVHRISLRVDRRHQLILEGRGLLTGIALWRDGGSA